MSRHLIIYFCKFQNLITLQKPGNTNTYLYLKLLVTETSIFVLFFFLND